MTTVPFGDLKRQYTNLQREIDEAVARVSASGWYILGPEVQAFEQAFASFCGVAHCIGVGNGTDALQLAQAALGIGPDDDVITVANAAMYETITTLALGATPIFVDVDATTHTLDPSLLEAAITPRTKAIIPVHLYGRMANMDAINTVATRHGIPVIEDCAQSHGAMRGLQKAGSIGLMGCFSFFPTKNLGALGDGGAVVTNDDDLAAKLRRLRQYGWGKKYFVTDLNGTNSRLDELQAAVLSAKLPYLHTWNARRRQIAARYNLLLDGSGLILPELPADESHVMHLYVVRVPDGRRDLLRAALQERGVGCDIHYPVPAHQQAPYSQFAPQNGLPVTEQLASEVLSLPCFPELTDAEIDAVAAAVREALA